MKRVHIPLFVASIFILYLLAHKSSGAEIPYMEVTLTYFAITMAGTLMLLLVVGVLFGAYLLHKKYGYGDFKYGRRTLPPAYLTRRR